MEARLEPSQTAQQLVLPLGFLAMDSTSPTRDQKIGCQPPENNFDSGFSERSELGLRRWETRHMAPELATKTWVRHIPPPPQRVGVSATADDVILNEAKPRRNRPRTYVSPRRKNPRTPTIIHGVGRSGQRRIDNGTKRASLIRTTPTSTQQRREDDAELTTCLKYGAPSVTGAAAHRRRLDLQRRKEALGNGGHRAPGGGGLREELQGGPWGEARGVLPLPGFFHCFGPPGEEGQAGGGLFLEGGEDGSGTKELLWLGCP
ncbi:hypothetical protein B296_00012814 [Ensete ventricosum]|uniref:Uncharacterized protein n=1 Tax=Ensete ventricosum TaxID=4639 RepID=A0A426ZC21_ENSVE|nr:hypothetical protein B296_00012814 [Ensete ventricosum]